MLSKRPCLNQAAAARLYEQLENNIVALQQKKRTAREATAIARTANAMVSLSRHMWQMLREGAQILNQSGALPAPKNGKRK